MKGTKLSLGLLILASGLLVGCGKNNGGNVSLQFGTYVARNFLMEYLVPTAWASVGEVKMCFKRLRFKQDAEDNSGPDDSQDNIDFNVGEVSLSASGTTLGEISVPPGVYRRLEFDLEDGCGNGYSLLVGNNHGNHQTTDRITIKFEGQFDADGSDQALTLAIEDIIAALDAYDGADRLKDVAEDISGDF